jgi:hypothetical protein
MLHPMLDQALASQRDDQSRPDLLEIYIQLARQMWDDSEDPEREKVLSLRHDWGDANVRLRIQVGLSPQDNPFLELLPDEALELLADQAMYLSFEVPMSEMIAFATNVLEDLPMRHIRRVES